MAQIFTGARGRVKIKDTVIGFCGGINITAEFTLADVDVLGQLETADLAEVGHKANFSINTFKAFTDVPEGASALTPQQSAFAIGIDTSSPATGVGSMRSQAYFDVIIEDSETGAVVATLERCKYEGGTGQMDARGVWQGTWNFRCTRIVQL